jgi:hypothetical protein
MNSSCASEIKKLHSKAGLIFGLSEQYFADIAYDRASVPEIQRLLGISISQHMPKPSPPILFPNLVEDPLLKTVFGNWELFFTTAMDRALAGVTEGEVHTAQPEPLIEDIMDEMVSDAEANRERPRPSSPLTSEPDEDEVSNIVTAPAAARGHRGGRAARCVVSNTSTCTTRNACSTT